MSLSMIPCPFIGRVHFAWHLKGLLSMSFIIFYWLYCTQMITWVVLWPGYNDSKISIGFIVIYWTIAVNCFLCIFKASSLHPGRIPVESIRGPEKGWTYCSKCQLRRPPRAHHCRRCGHCVARLDHHCPWINNCVGADNHYAFIQLLSYAIGLSLLSLLVAVMHVFVYSPCTTCDNTEYIHEHSTTMMVTVIVLCIIMSILMTSMWFVQYYNLMTNRTTLQNIIEPPTIEAEWESAPCILVYEKYFGLGPCYRWIWPCYKKPSEFVEARADIV